MPPRDVTRHARKGAGNGHQQRYEQLLRRVNLPLEATRTATVMCRHGVSIVLLVLLERIVVDARKQRHGGTRSRYVSTANGIADMARGQMSAGTYTTEYDATYSYRETDIAGVFGGWWGKNTTSQEFSSALASNRAIHIQNFLQPEFAAALHRELYDASDTPAFQRYTAARKNYQYRYSAQYAEAEPGSQKGVFPSLPLATRFLRALDCRAMKRWLERVAGCKVSGRTAAGATFFQPGDYIGLHTDVMPETNAGDKRRLTYVFHLAKDWQSVNGGDLVFASPTSIVAASYNTMTIFAVTKAAWHLVTPVWEQTPPDRKRLSIAGWWMSDDPDEASRLERRFHDDWKAAQHVTVINGTTGEKVLHETRSVQPSAIVL